MNWAGERHQLCIVVEKRRHTFKLLLKRSRALNFLRTVSECDVLKQLNHENVVKCLAIENIINQANKVIVMELCTGGSVQMMLDDPQYMYGFPEPEFLTLLGDVVNGMKYLTSSNIVHRDIKPGNIMRFVSSYGSSIYKLADFGAARELPEGNEFASIYGTLEFLDPAMYITFVTRNNTKFTADVDLWSMGVTLYQVATGCLPFKPYVGRQDHETMLKMICEKQYGDISANQKSKNGEVEWHRNLPRTCTLSKELQSLLVDILAGLLEKDKQRSLTFEEFFKAVDGILDKRWIYIFDPKLLQLSHVVIAKGTNLTKATLAERLNETLETVQFFFNGRPFLSTAQSDDDVMPALSAATIQNPIHVIGLTSTDHTPQDVEILSNAIDSYPNQWIQSQPQRYAKNYVAIMIARKQQTSLLMLKQKLLHECVVNFRLHIYSKLDQLQESTARYEVQIMAESKRFHTIFVLLEQFYQRSRFADDNPDHTCSIPKNLEDSKNEHDNLLGKLQSNVSAVHSLYHKLMNIPRYLESSWTGDSMCKEDDHCEQFIDTCVKQAHNIIEMLRQYKMKTSQGTAAVRDNDTSISMSEINQLYRLAFEVKHKFNDHCVHNTTTLHEKFCIWLTSAQSVYAEINKLAEEQTQLNALVTECATLTQQLENVNIVRLLDESPSKSLEQDSRAADTDSPKLQFLVNPPQTPAENDVTGATTKSNMLLAFSELSDTLLYQLQCNNNAVSSLSSLVEDNSSIEAIISSPLPISTKSTFEDEDQFVQSVIASGTYDSITASGWTILHQVAYSGENFENIKKLVCEYNLDMDALTNELATPLHLSCMRASADCVRYLLEHSSNVNAVDSRGRTPLIYACISANLTAAELVLSKQPNVLRQDMYGNTCLHYAVLKADIRLVEQLLGTSNELQHIRNNHNETCIHVAARIANLELLDYFISKCDRDLPVPDMNGDTALHIAVRYSNYHVVNYLLSLCKLDINSRNEQKMTALMQSCKNGPKCMVELLLNQENININLQDSLEMTALMYAVKSGNPEVVSLLINKNIVLSMSNSKGRTVLHIACKRVNMEILLMLMSHKHIKSIINLVDYGGKTALHYLAMSGTIEEVNLLLAAGAKTTITDKLLKLPKFYADKTGNIEAYNVLCVYDFWKFTAQ